MRDLNFLPVNRTPRELPIHAPAVLKEKGDIFWLE